MIGAAVGSVVGGLAQASAAKSAGNAQADAAEEANQTQRYIYDRNVELSAPWRDAGQNALMALQYELGGERPTFGGTEYRGFKASPGYQFRLDEGNKAIERMAAARGLRLSSGTLKDAARFNQGEASQEYGNYYNRLASLAGTGQTAVQNTQRLGQNYASNVGANLRAAGQARASGYQGMANAFGGTINSLGGIAGAASSGMYGPNPGFGITPSPAGLQAWGWS